MLFLITLIICTALLVVLSAVFLGQYLDRKRYTFFISKNSVSLHALEKINSAYTFFPSVNYNQSHTYDNKNFYDTISCKDFLIYQLQDKADKIGDQIKKTDRNKEEYQKYLDQVKGLQLGEFSAPIGKLNQKRLLEIEEKLIHRAKFSAPSTNFLITVTLYCSKINGDVYDRKRETFSAETILSLIKRLRNKAGTFYRDREIWEAICRVERGKVSDKMRFSIYARDGYRCRNCGVSERYAKLEIDHIIPIAKGGKSTYDNLQTLCHKCNVEKGNKV